MDSFALAVSIALQHGVSLKLFCEKFAHTRFEPSGWTQQSRHRLRQVDHGLHLPLAAAALHRTAAIALRKSAAEVERAVVRGSGVRHPASGDRNREPGAGSIHAADALAGIIDLGDAPTCSFCGSIMTRNGSCYRCGSCGSTSGCS